MGSALAQPLRFTDEWQSFKSRFVTGDGRVIDDANGDVSHSEGQGWGLLFAATAGDRAGFDLILDWTTRVLRRPEDHLHAWRYVPKDTPPVRDLNNAVDGDMFIAAALSRAGRLWGRPEFVQRAAAIAKDILRLSVRQVGPFIVLLPGLKGFEDQKAIVINPSYYAFPMMAELAVVAPDPQWSILQRDGEVLLERGRFGRWSLPPDWLRIGKADLALSPAPGWPPRFSYDAIRVPLWWGWQRLPLGPAMFSVERFWTTASPGSVPAWADLETNQLAPYPATAGTTAIMRVLRQAIGPQLQPEARQDPPQYISSTKHYYDAALVLLSAMAENEMKSN